MSTHVFPCPKCGAQIPVNAALTGLDHACQKQDAPLQSKPANVIPLKIPGRFVVLPQDVKQPGDYAYIPGESGIKAIRCILPGFTSAIELPVDGTRGWKLAGTPDKPTVTPSIDAKGEASWHGYLTDGEFVPC